MAFLSRFFLLQLTIILVACMLAGCQGSGVATGLLEYSTPPAAETGPPGMPEFPGDEEFDTAKRVVAQQDNIQPGKDACWRSASGAMVMGDSLVLSTDGGNVAWGVWRWGQFETGFGIIPIDLTIDVEPSAQGQFWLLLADYDAQRWEVHGPLDGSVTVFEYSPGINYVSSNKCAYAALVAEGGNGLTVNQLNLRADADVTPPPAPTDLTITVEHTTQIVMTWTHVDAADLWRYKIYSGPSPDFDLDDEGVRNIGEVDKEINEFTAKYLTPGETYYFCVTGLDAAQNESLPSNIATGTTPLTDTPLPPTNLTVEATGSSWADLSWTASTSPSLWGYDAYTHPTDPDFEVGEPGVIWRNEATGLIKGTSWRMTGLASETQYYCRLRSNCDSVKSALGNTAQITTTTSLPPVPDFRYAPVPPKVGVDVFFDPARTTDEDTALEELEFVWDFENDGTPDQTTVGPEMVTHIYPDRGPITAKLTVSDGTAVSTTKDFFVGSGYRYVRTASSFSYSWEMVGVDSDPGSSRLAVLGNAGTGFSIRLYDGGSWQTVSLDEITDYTMLTDVAITATGLYVLALKASGSSWNIRPYGYTGGHWSEIDSIPISRNGGLENGRLSVSGNDRLGIAVVGVTHHISKPADYDLSVWHEKADGSYRTGNKIIGSGSYSPVDIVRNDSTSFAIHHYNNRVKLGTFTDDAASTQDMQVTFGTMNYLAIGYDPADDSHVYWAGAFDNSLIFYGDNYGTANGTNQSYTASLDATGSLGVGLAGDNESVFYWTDEDANEVQHLLGHDTSANGGAGETYLVGEGIGFSGGGSGIHFTEDAKTGVYAIANEVRDGELTGYFMVDGAASSTMTVVHQPPSADIKQRHQALSLGGAVLTLSEQQYPTALASYASSPEVEFTTNYVGLDNWCVPQAACATAVADEYFVGGCTKDITGEDNGLIVNRYNWGTAEGTEELYVAGIKLANLEHNTVTNEVLLCYTTSNAQDIVVRDWDGATWSGETLVYDGSTTIEALVLRHNAAGEWGLALLSDTDEVRLVEAPGGAWGASSLLSTEPVNGDAGIGLAYNTDGDLCVAVERNGATPGLYLGIKPVAESIGWEKLVDTDGASAWCMYAFYHKAEPLLLYYNWAGSLDDSRMHYVEMLDGVWYDIEYAFHIHGNPVDAILDPATNNIIMAGYSRLGDMTTARVAVVAILYP
jgi:hypothetical protein